MKGTRTVTSFHRELGKIMWEHCGMGRNKAGLEQALQKIPALREEFWRNLNVPGSADELNQSLEMAGRVADFLELGELMCLDALEREESCGGHFREEYQTAEGRGAARRRALLPRGGLGVRRGGSKARYATSSPSSSRTCPCRPGATNERQRQEHEPHPARLAAEERLRQGALRHLPGEERQPRHVLPRDAGRGQRGAHHEGRGPDRLRPRLPRGHLRHVQHRRERPAPRAAHAHHRLPAPHADASRTATRW